MGGLISRCVKCVQLLEVVHILHTWESCQYPCGVVNFPFLLVSSPFRSLLVHTGEKTHENLLTEGKDYDIVCT